LLYEIFKLCSRDRERAQWISTGTRLLPHARRDTLQNAVALRIAMTAPESQAQLRALTNLSAGIQTGVDDGGSNLREA
jgi:hypothetical protein